MNTFSVISRLKTSSFNFRNSVTKSSQNVRQNSGIKYVCTSKPRLTRTTFSMGNFAPLQRSAFPTLFNFPLHHTTRVSFGSARFNSTSSNVSVVDNTTGLAHAADDGSVLTTVGETIDTDVIIDAAMRVGDLKAMGLINYTPVGFTQAAMEFIHVSTGIPWWGTIVVTTLLIRLALLPIVLKLQRNAATLHNIKPEMDRLTIQLSKARMNGDTAAIAQYSHGFKDLFEKHNANPFKMLALPLMQAPVMLTFFFALRDMAQLPVPQFQNGGLAWFTDLTTADPYYILPVISGLGFLTILELGSGTGTNVGQTKNMKWFFRFMTVAMVPVTASLSSSIFIYWATSNFFSIGQVIALKSPIIRKRLGIPLLVEHKVPITEVSKKPIINIK